MMDTTQILEKTKRAYNSPAWWYDVRGFFILKLSYQSGLFRQIRFFGNNMGPHHLEVAIGTGSLFALLLLYRVLNRLPASKTSGFDLAPKMLEGARARVGKKTELFLGDVCHLNLPDHSFDSINVANAFHCFPDPATALQELYRVLKPSGTLAMNVLLQPSGNRLRDRIARRINAWGIKKGILFKPYELETIFALIDRSKFRTIKITQKGNSLEFLLDSQKREPNQE